jgi:hypothetical protein
VGNSEVEQIINFLVNNRRSYQFTGVPILEGLSYIAIDQEGYITLIVKTNERISYSFSTNYISLKLSNYCQIVTADQEYEGYCHMLRCKTHDIELVKMFAMLCLAIGKQITIDKNSERMITFFNGLVQLFKITPAANLSKERQGLWGELFLLKQLPDTFVFIQYWHSENTRKFDFSCGNLRLEVKTTMNKERIHSFSHNQVYREDDIDIAVASVLLQEEDAGLSLQELIQEIKDQVKENPIELLKLEKAIKQAGMSDINESGPIFDYGYARSNLAWYYSINVPKFNQAEPKGVSNTYYKIDLSTALNMSVKEKEQWLLNWN